MPILIMVIPAVAACFLSTPYWEVSFVAAFDYRPYLTAAQTFKILFGDSWQYLWPVFIIATLQVFSASLLMSAIDRHFRTGRFSLRDPWRLVNNSVFPLAIGVAIMSVMSILWRLLLFGLVTLVQTTAGAISLSEGAAIAIISAVAVGMFILHVMIITPMLFWAPIMFMYGYRFRDAAATSFKMISGKKTFIGLFLPMLACAGIQLLVGFLQVHASIACVVNFFVFLFTNVYATVYTILAFYDITDLARRDVKLYGYAQISVPVRKPDTEQEKSQAKTEDAPVVAKRSKPVSPHKRVKDGGKPPKQKANVGEEGGDGV